MDYMRLLPHVHWAIRCANVRYPNIAGAMLDLPTRSRLRGDDKY